MKTLDTKINNLKIIKPKIYRDNRGYFFEIFNLKKYKKIISDNRFVQDDHSFSKKNVLRGIHFQHKKPQNQLLYLVEGKIFIVFTTRVYFYYRLKCIHIDTCLQWSCLCILF